ncbi:DNA topoisomerase [Criibacterium bergeronii]|uniref:DNA topoisomerase n=1 Tax=Criibacterium bergeronii TaxID=1871336 RepID=A0A552UXI1_9FIRM|nr:type IA DNA topoisomerase [Criibacterium bergeronii]TRW22902.1 DNA topoisomerase [Criibacterium bergeronii]
MKKLIIAEKPSLAKNIADSLGVKTVKNGYYENDKYVISFAFGHLFSLKDIDDYLGEKKKWKDVELPFFPKAFEFKLKNDDGVKKQYSIIKELVKREDITEIVNCGDADREGQIIIDIIVDNIGTDKKKTRLWLPEQTAHTIRQQIENCKDNIEYLNLKFEGLARTYIDWLYGINLTRYVTVKTNNMFPCGRVLIPIVKYIYDRDIEIQNFKPEKYYNIESKTTVKGDEVLLQIKEPKYSLEEKETAQAKADELNTYKAKVIDISEKEIKKQAPKLFSLSKLQSKLSKDYKIQFADSMKIIQKLYEDGYITYPRTNTEYLAENEKEKVKKLINSSSNYNLKMKDSKKIFDDSKIESHSALLPTTKIPTNLSKDEEIIYNTVLNRFISNFLDEEAIINQIQIKIAVNDQIFDLKGQSIKQLGYLKYESEKIENKLPKLEKDEEFDVDFKLVEKTTTPPKKITEETLSNYLKNPFRKEKSNPNNQQDNLLDEQGTQDDEKEYQDILKGVEIGTEATRTGIIENAKKYEYITQDKQTFSITEKGIYFIQILDKLKIDLYKEKTVETSMLQKQVLKKEIFLGDCIELVEKQISEIINQDIKIEKLPSNVSDTREVIGICPRCGKNIYENSKSYYCDGYKDKENPCKFSIWKENKFFEDKGKKLTKTMVKQLLKKGYVDVKGFKSKEKNKEYDAKVNLKDTGTYVNFEMEFSKK